MENEFKLLFTSIQTREGLAYDDVSDEFYKLFIELLTETERDAYFSRADDLRNIINKIKLLLITNSLRA